jgi:hypothetical protein
LCNPKVAQALSLVDTPNCFLDKNIARATAQFVRQTTPVQAIFVPSMAFLDRLDKWVLVLFLEKLSSIADRYLPSVSECGFLSVDF